MNLHLLHRETLNKSECNSMSALPRNWVNDTTLARFMVTTLDGHEGCVNRCAGCI